MKSIVPIGILLLCPSVILAQVQTPPPDQTPGKVGGSTFEENESVWSISPFYWKPRGKARLIGGQASPDPAGQTTDLFGRYKGSPGIMITIPTGRSNRVEIVGWEAKNAGNTTLPKDVNFFGQNFAKNDFLVTEDRIRAARITWNYLTYPYPPLDSKFRIKTLWEFQYVQATPTITAPYTATAATATADATPAKRTTGKRTVYLPTVGLGMEWIPSAKHFRIEARLSGMGFPKKSQIADGEVTAVLRLWNLEIYAGGRGYHFQSTTKRDEYVKADLWGPEAGVRWVFR